MVGAELWGAEELEEPVLGWDRGVQGSGQAASMGRVGSCKGSEGLERDYRG